MQAPSFARPVVWLYSVMPKGKAAPKAVKGKAQAKAKGKAKAKAKAKGKGKAAAKPLKVQAKAKAKGKAKSTYKAAVEDEVPAEVELPEEPEVAPKAKAKAKGKAKAAAGEPTLMHSKRALKIRQDILEKMGLSTVEEALAKLKADLAEADQRLVEAVAVEEATVAQETAAMKAFHEAQANVETCLEKEVTTKRRLVALEKEAKEVKKSQEVMKLNVIDAQTRLGILEVAAQNGSQLKVLEDQRRKASLEEASKAKQRQQEAQQARAAAKARAKSEAGAKSKARKAAEVEQAEEEEEVQEPPPKLARANRVLPEEEETLPAFVMEDGEDVE